MYGLRDIIEYVRLPDTEESLEIDRRWLEDEISADEFHALARKYIKENKNGDT